MPTPPETPEQVTDVDAPVHARRWLVLAVLCVSVFLIVVDNTIVNVALPTLARELGADTSELQWIVDAYTLVFAGLLLAAGSLGDRFGRKGALQIGLVLFGLFSAAAAFSQTPGQLIASRAAMGIGAALIFPATLAILVNVFRESSERAKAIGIWAAVSGLSVALGPVTGGWLLEHFWWGSVFLVNIPIVVVGVLAVRAIVPRSRDPKASAIDAVGLALSIVGVTLLIWAIIEAPHNGWTSPTILGAFTLAAASLASFVVWELRSSHPMLDVRVFTNMRFTAGSLSVTFAFFALFGFIFMVTQYFQFVRGYGTLEAGIRTVPFAVFTGIAAPLSARLALRFGTKVIVTLGLLSMSVGFFLASNMVADSPYWFIVVSMFFMGAGLGLVNAPATEAIMGSLPPAKAGVGSAVNDTTRELGGTLGVAIVGSLFASVYGSAIVDAFRGTPMPPEALRAAQDSVGAAYAVADQAPPPFGDAIRSLAASSFMDGFAVGTRVAAAVVLVGAVLALVFLPARARRRDEILVLGTDPVALATGSVPGSEGSVVGATSGAFGTQGG